MKLSNKYFTAATLAAFAVSPLLVAGSVSAATWNEAVTCDASNNCVLNADVTESVIISSDTVLDLNGHNITSSTGDAIYVENGVSLTINGSGQVESQKKGYASIFNNGTTTLNGGTYYKDDDAYMWYTIANHGTMIINDGVTVKNKNDVNTAAGNGSSLIENGYSSYTSSTNERKGYVAGKGITNPTLTINGGTFDGGMNTVKNDDNGILTINGGTFSNTFQVAVLNWNIATINGGTFNVPTGNDKTTIFVSSYGASSVDKGVLTINGGTFNGEYIVEVGTKLKSGVTNGGDDPSAASVTITGGTFNSTIAFDNSSERMGWSSLATSSITGGAFADENVTPDAGYTSVPITINGEAGILVTTATLDTTAVELATVVGNATDTGLHDDIKTYGTWTVDDSSVANVSNGIITALKAGTTKVTVSFNNSTKTYNLTVSESTSGKGNVTSPDTGANTAETSGASLNIFAFTFCGAILGALLSPVVVARLNKRKEQ